MQFQKKDESGIHDRARKALLRERVVLQRFEEKLNSARSKASQAQVLGLVEEQQKFQDECAKIQKKYDLQLDSYRVMMNVFKNIEAKIKLEGKPGGLEN